VQADAEGALPNAPPPTAEGGFGIGDFFRCIQISFFIGVLLGIPVALAFSLDYASAAFAVGAGSFLLCLLIALLTAANPQGRNPGIGAVTMLLRGILIVGLGIGLLSYVVLKLSVESKKSSPPPVYSPVLPTVQ
jgi:hypothetical protein